MPRAIIGLMMKEDKWWTKVEVYRVKQRDGNWVKAEELIKLVTKPIGEVDSSIRRPYRMIEYAFMAGLLGKGIKLYRNEGPNHATREWFKPYKKLKEISKKLRERMQYSNLFSMMGIQKVRRRNSIKVLQSRLKPYGGKIPAYYILVKPGPTQPGVNFQVQPPWRTT